MRARSSPSLKFLIALVLFVAIPFCSGAQQPKNARAPTGINLDKPFTPPADVKIDVAQFGSLPQGTPYFVSPHGAHVAMLAHAGSRVQIVEDGVAGPVFDSILATGGPMVAFSADGNHYGYCGVSGNQMAVMVDGKQVGTSSEVYVNGFECEIVFSPDSKHFYYINHVGTDGAHTHARLVVDGKQEVDVGDMHQQNFVFTPDGDHFGALLDAYPPRPAPNGQELLLDGNITNLPGQSPVFSVDSQHVFTVGGVGQKQVLYRDGQPLMSASRITLGAPPLNPGITAPPAGDAPVAIGYDSNGGVGGVLQEQWYLTMNGKQIPGTLVQRSRGQGSMEIQNLLVSHDGKHYAAICKDANNKTYLFADGKKGQVYDGIGPATVQFTPGSGEPVYVATNGGVQYLVVDTQETAIPNINSVVVSPVGDRVAAFGRGGFVDGQPLNISGNNPATIQIMAFNFSPDGKHYAYVVLAKGTEMLYVDGVVDPAHNWIAPAVNGANFSVWSQGNNIAYVCGSTNPAAANQANLCFDGKAGYLADRPVFGNLTLTPDASHIFFYEGIAQGGFRLFLDGA